MKLVLIKEGKLMGDNLKFKGLIESRIVSYFVNICLKGDLEEDKLGLKI